MGLRRASEQASRLDQQRMQHLGFIQGAVSRMAAASAQAKTWLLPVNTVAFGYALAQDEWPIALIGIGSTILFASIDARYLREERAFRALYIRAVDGAVPPYDMNSRPYYGRTIDKTEDHRAENCRWGKVIGSWSILGFYGPITIAGVAIVASLIIFDQ